MNPPPVPPAINEADSLVPESTLMSSVNDSGYQSYDSNRFMSPRIVTSSPFVDDHNLATLVEHFKSATPIACVTRRPRVNFHSIQDLISDPRLDFDEIPSTQNDERPVEIAQPTRDVYTEASTKRRIRTRFTEEQKTRLENWYRLEQYPSIDQYEELSQQLSLDQAVIKVWFQNKRARTKNMRNH